MVRKYLKWRYIRWAIAIPTLPAALWACTSHPLMQPKPAPEQDTNIYINVNPSRKLDLVFLIDNSKSMEPKQLKLKEQFPKLVAALEDKSANPPFPDLRIAIINSDLGTGGSGRCPRQYGDQGKFQMLKATECGVQGGATFLEYKQGKAMNYTGDIAQAFGCLATAVGAEGCGYEQQLQALNWAFNLESNLSQRNNFLREDAYLGIVILSDEDDCSTPPTSLLAAEDKITVQESWSLRCATRGHQCGGANLTYPTNASYEKDFSACKARIDSCDPKETGKDATSCSPLADIKALANSIKQLKGGDAEKFLVAGIFGWPTEAQTSSTYKIAMAPNPNAGQPDQYDYWPVCYDPDHPMPAGGAADRAAFDQAFGWGGFGGLRIKAFLDEFPDSLAFSICEKDYSKSMKKIGDALAAKLSNLCVKYKLLDTDLNAQGVQADCRVVDRIPNGPGKYTESPAMPHCDVANGAKPCWRVVADDTKCPKATRPGGLVVPSQLIVVDRVSAPPTDTRVGMKCRTCAELSANLDEIYQVPGCRY